jgi:FkbM family methyltransferase
MDLYYKQYLEYPVKIPGDAFITDKKGLDPIKAVPDFPVSYCWEIQIIHKISRNEESFFDFSKGMIDIGAGFGEYSWILPFKFSHAFEPCRQALYIMHTNLVTHEKIYHTTTYEVGLSDKEETVYFDGFNTDAGNAENYDSEKAKPLQVKTLDSFGFENIGFIKIDIEGMEEKALRGGLETIKSNGYPPILFECWPIGYNTMTQEKHDSLYKFLEELGYTIYERWGDYETHLAVHNKKEKVRK